MRRIRSDLTHTLTLATLVVAALSLFVQPLAAQQRTPKPDGGPHPEARAPGARWEFRTAEGGPVVAFGPRGFLGVQLIEMTPELRRHMGAPEDAGVLIGKVEPDSPAAQAGLQVGDILTRVEGEPISNPFEVTHRIAPKENGEAVTVTVWRDGSALDFTANVVRKEFEGLPRVAAPRVHVLPRGDFQFRGPDGEVVELKDLPNLPDIEWFDAERMGEVFKSPEWAAAMDRFQADRGPLLKRIDELEKRLAEMETLLKKLEKK